ncbi:hypothetical protein [Pseudoduganella lutea]|uniref:Uncharacterized protein n=1 Tax=Pseudoduganella lutea TaxID=321985 RepID=A0A4P6L528_9BURK|nr:hypothetical protein [Pseudoduganella lutea]QBE65942.1 hypothetical protein EWM63_25590 [Pseudoduganella lutea]
MLSRAGAAPVASGLQQCKAVLATTRLEKRGAVYYLAMFELASGKRHVAIVPVTPDGQIASGNALADIVNASAAKDIRSARAALARALP